MCCLTSSSFLTAVCYIFACLGRPWEAGEGDKLFHYITTRSSKRRQTGASESSGERVTEWDTQMKSTVRLLRAQLADTIPV